LEGFLAVDFRYRRNTNARDTCAYAGPSVVIVPRDVISRHNCQTAGETGLLSRSGY
jgi:hypothetical protein